MKVHLITPFSLEKDLGKAYNESMELIPYGDFVCITDYDVAFLNSKSYEIITKYIDVLIDLNKQNTAMMVCYTNRIHPMAKEQLLNGFVDEDDNFKNHIRLSIEQQVKGRMHLTPCKGPLSGFLMVMSKEFWKVNKFQENSKCLGIDTEYYKRIRSNGTVVYRMDSLYVWHTYRLLNGILDKQHLL